MLDIKNVSYRYASSAPCVLEDINLQIGGGGVYGLLGANGEGKSTLLYLICGLLKPRTGYVTCEGTPTLRRLPSTLSSIFIVPEEFTLPDMTVMQYAALNAPLYPNFSYDDLNAYLSIFNSNPDMSMASMSMGQRKKAFIAYALATNTPYLLMDEPTNGLDIPGKGEFRRVISQADTNGRTIVISTHQVRDLDDVLTNIIMLARHRVLLNTSLRHVASRISFVFTAMPDPDDRLILYRDIVPGGFQLVRACPSEPDGKVNLESLFNLAYNNPDALRCLY